MKKRILIAVESLESGGVEVSLVRLLNALILNKDISLDLLLLQKKGIYLDKIPKKVNIIELQTKNKLYNYNNTFSYVSKLGGLKKIKFIIFKLKKFIYEKFNRTDLYYKLLLKNTIRLPKKYDIAIDYLGYGHFLSSYIIEKVDASKKVMWIHDEKNDWLSKIDCWLEKYDKFFCVSKSCMSNLLSYNSNLKSKVDVFYNLINYEEIREKATEKVDCNFDDDVCNIITVGRIEWQKAYDIAVQVAVLLKEKDFKFCWRVIGGGTLREEIEELVISKGLENDFKFLGIKTNPFPYIKKADLYLQTSRHEGYGLAIAETRVLGTIPIATNLNCVSEQIIDGETGFLCELDPKKFADKIIEVYNDKELMKKVKSNLSKENFDYSSELEKIYDLFK